MRVLGERRLERDHRLADLLERNVGGQQILRRLDRDEIAERVIEPAAFANGRSDEAGLHPVAQSRFLHRQDTGDISDGVELDHDILLYASTPMLRYSSAPRARLSTSTVEAASSQPAMRRASATATRRAWSRARSSAAYRNAIRCAVDASGGSLTRSAARARSIVSIVDPEYTSPTSSPSLNMRAASCRRSTAMGASRTVTSRSNSDTRLAMAIGLRGRAGAGA